MRYREPLTIPIRLDREPAGEFRRSLHDQIANQLGMAVDQGRLPGGARVPSTRTLAALLGVSRGVTSAAYAELLARGYLEARHGSGTYVAVRGAAVARAPRWRGSRRLSGTGSAALIDTASNSGPLTDAALAGGALTCAALSGGAVSGGAVSGGVLIDKALAGGALAGGVLIDLMPGRPNGEIFPLAAWRAAWRRAASAPPPAALPPLGLPELRGAVARHLVASTGVPLDGHVVVVTGGITHGLRLILDALGLTTPRPTNPGLTASGPTASGPTASGPTASGPTTPGLSTSEPTVSGPSTPGPSTPGPSTPGPSTPGLSTPGPDAATVALEDPAPPAVRRAVGGCGAPAPLAVDREGARLDGIPAGCRALLLAPDGQLPLARAMSSARRRAAATWARSTGGHLVEIVPAVPPRPGAVPLPGLLTPDTASQVTLVGGLCEQLTPALQLGYLAVPAALAARVERLIHQRGEQPSYIAQLAVARLLRDGTVPRLNRRLSQLYGHKRRLLVSTLAPLLGTVGMAGQAPPPGGVAPDSPALPSGAVRPDDPVVMSGRLPLDDPALPSGAARLDDPAVMPSRLRLDDQAVMSGRIWLDDQGATGTAVLYLPDPMDADQVAAALLARGVRVRTLAAYHWTGRPVPPALLLGYGHLPAPALRRGLTVVGEVLAGGRPALGRVS